MKKLKKWPILTVVMLLILAGAFAAGYFMMGGAKPGPTISGDVIKQQISEISELSVKQIAAFVGNFAGVKDEYTVVFA